MTTRVQPTTRAQAYWPRPIERADLIGEDAALFIDYQSPRASFASE
ncbi:MAG: hypothetical protein ACM359_12005 [Bacillota bacterium]